MGVHFNGGNKSAPAFCVKVNRTYSGLSAPGVTISERLHVCEKLGGKIHQITSQGLKCNGKWFTPPSIVLRNNYNNSNNGILRIFLAQTQYEELATAFRLPLALMKDAFFLIAEGNSGNTTGYQMVPSWSELLDPGWAGAYRQWLEQPTIAPLPNPNIFEWSSLSNGFLPLPGFEKANPLFSSRKSAPIRGSLLLRICDGHAQAVFQWPGNNKKTYELGLDSYSCLTQARHGGGSFNLIEFKKLFGIKAQINYYEASQAANSDGMVRLGSLAGQKLVLIPTPKIQFKPGQLYYFVFRRETGKVAIECYLDQKRDVSSFYGQRDLLLNDGLPWLNTVPLEKGN